MGDGEPVEIPHPVLMGLEYVRGTGRTNMFDAEAVMAIAMEEDYHEVVVWLDENKEKYARGVLHGFRSELDEEPKVIRKSNGL